MALLGSLVTGFLVAIIVLLIVYYRRKSRSPAKQYSVVTGTFTFQNYVNILTGKQSFVETFISFYADFKKHRYGEIRSLFGGPLLFICDPELIKEITTKEFTTFHDRTLPHDEENDPYSSNLVNLVGHRWKTIRSKLSPTFTSGKIKGMFPLLQECSQELRESIKHIIKDNNHSVDVKEQLIHFTTNVIGTCAFGIQCHSHGNPNNEFYKRSREIFKAGLGDTIRRLLVNAFPRLQAAFTFERQYPEAVKFFSDTIKETVEYRKRNNVERNDFLQMMMKINEEDEETFSFKAMVANTMLFFFAGLDNLSRSIGFCLHEMALNPELQEKVYEEIRTVLEAHNGEMSYEALGKMDLVARVIDEGLRKYPTLRILNRKQTGEKFTIPGTDFVSDKGTLIMLPIDALHHDPEYFPNPDKFDPDRFTNEEKQKRNPYVYMPFGEGPRFCIASRFSLMVMRLCFAELIQHFRLSVGPKTEVNIKLDGRAFGAAPKNGFWLAISERSKT